MSDERERGGVPVTVWLWLVVVIEIVSPLPAFLTLGAVWVLVARPPWFRALVADLYAEVD